MFRRVSTVFSFFLVTLVFAGNLSAQTEEKLLLNSPVSVYHAADAEDWYYVRTTHTGFLLVETSGDYDTYLEAFDGGRNSIRRDDDSGEGYNASLEIPVVENTTYLFKVTFYDSAESGEYGIEAVNYAVPPDMERNTERAAAVVINSGDSVPVYFRSEGESRWYSLNPAAGGSVLKVYTEGNIDTRITCYDSRGNSFMEDDDSGDGYNARVTVSPGTGPFYIKVSTYGGGTGRCSLFVGGVEAPLPLAAGSSIPVDMPAGGEKWYSVRAGEAGLLTVKTVGEYDTYLEAFDSAYNYISSNDDSGGDYNAGLEIFVSPNTDYIFRLTNYNSGESGSYTIAAALESMPPDAMNTERGRALTVNAGDSVPVYLRSADESRWYAVNVNEAGVALRAYTEGSIDTVMRFYNSSGELVKEDDDSGSGYNARLTVTVEPGVWYFEVRSYGSSSTGRSSFFLQTAERGRPDQFEPDDSSDSAKEINVDQIQERTFTDSDDEDWARVTITRPGFYEIRSQANDGLMDSYLELFDSQNNLISSNDDSGGYYDARISTDLEPGTYYIHVYCVSDEPENNRYTLHVRFMR